MMSTLASSPLNRFIPPSTMVGTSKPAVSGGLTSAAPSLIPQAQVSLEQPQADIDPFISRGFSQSVKEGDLAGLGANFVDQDGFIPDNNSYRGFSTGQRMMNANLSAEQIGASHVFGRGVAIAGREGGYAAMRHAFDLAAQGQLDSAFSERDAAFIRFTLAQSQATGFDPAEIGEALFLQATDVQAESTKGTFTNIGASMGGPIPDQGARLDIHAGDNSITPDVAFFSSWYHDRLDNGRVDGSIWFTELASGKALMGDGVSQDTIVALARLEAADGDIGNNSANKLQDANGNGLFTKLFAGMYTGAKNLVNPAEINALADQQAAANGISVDQLNNMVVTTVNNFSASAGSVIQGLTSGFGQGFGAAFDVAKDDPAALAGGAMGGAALSAICPFFGAGVGAASQASLKAPPTSHSNLSIPEGGTLA